MKKLIVVVTLATTLAFVGAAGICKGKVSIENAGKVSTALVMQPNLVDPGEGG